MVNITEIVDIFLTQMVSLPDRGGRQLIDVILQPAIQAENDLRVLMAQEPQHPILSDPYVGLLDAFAIPADARRTRPRSFNDPKIGINLQSNFVCLFPHSYLLELDPVMRRSPGSPCFVADIREFKRNWNVFTHNALSGITDWSNIIAAGGSVLGCLTTFALNMSNVELNDFYHSLAYNESDIDIFLWGLSPDEAKRKMLEMFDEIRAAVPFHVTCVRKANTISMHTAWPNRPIQIVLRLYKSPAEVLAGFDVDSACCLYNGDKVYVNPRALAASVRQCNTIDLSRRSPSYEVRLAKYADRGFEVFYPSLDRTRIDTVWLYDRQRNTYPNGLARLIVLEMLRCFQNYYHCLYRHKRTSGPEPPNRTSALDYRPVQKLLASNYDYAYIHIPYRTNWNAYMVQRLIRRIDHKMNSAYNPHNIGRRLHRHAATCGTMRRCLYATCCFNCPVPLSAAERQLVLEEEMINIRGRLEFIVNDPGRQIITGSFRPITVDDWSAEAYRQDGLNSEDYDQAVNAFTRVEGGNGTMLRRTLDRALIHALQILDQNRNRDVEDNTLADLERHLTTALNLSQSASHARATVSQLLQVQAQLDPNLAE